MPRPDRLVTEDDFPLDVGGEDTFVEPFDVVVRWHDLSETPSQAVVRLNGEVCELAAASLPVADLLARRLDRRLLDIARDACADAPADAEYVRGQAELLCEYAGISTDRKDDVAAHLTQEL